MSFNKPKQWWAVKFGAPVNRVYMFPVESERELDKITKHLSKVAGVERMKWQDMVYWLNVIVPVTSTLSDYASGPLNFKQAQTLVTVWPM